MSLDPLKEVKYRYTLALQSLSRAENLYKLKDWAGSVHFSQLAVENFAKALIAVFEMPAWNHDPSNQLLRLKNKLPKEHTSGLDELAAMTRTLAPEHARSAYGEPEKGLTPADIYAENHAFDAVNRARRAKEIVEKTLNILKAF